MRESRGFCVVLRAHARRPRSCSSGNTSMASARSSSSFRPERSIPARTRRACAMRELAEETGYTGAPPRARPHVICGPDELDSRCHVFLVRDARRTAEPTPDLTEEIDVLLVPLDECARWRYDGRIAAGSQVAAFLVALAPRCVQRSSGPTQPASASGAVDVARRAMECAAQRGQRAERKDAVGRRGDDLKVAARDAPRPSACKARVAGDVEPRRIRRERRNDDQRAPPPRNAGALSVAAEPQRRMQMADDRAARGRRPDGRRGRASTRRARTASTVAPSIAAPRVRPSWFPATIVTRR